MADNTTLDAGSGGDVIAADDISSVKYQRIKLIHGADGVNAGDVALANGLPVQPATSAAFPVTDNGATLSVDDGGSSLTVDGTVTVTATNLSTNVAQYGGSAVGATNAVHVQAGTGATFPITDNSGSITVDNGGTFAVQAAQSGTWNVATLTSITNVVHVDDNSSTLSVDDGGGSLTVDGTVSVSGTVTVGSHAVTNAGTFAVQVDGAALTALQLLDDVVLTEDAAHASGDKGVMALAVRQDTNSSLVGASGDYSPLQVDSTGSLKVAIISGAGSGGTASTDQAAFTASSTSGTPAMGAYDDTGPSTLTEDKLGILRMTAYRGLHVNLRDASGAEVSVGGGTQYDEDAAHSSGSKVTGCGIVRKDTAASLAGTDGDYTLPIADANGKLWVNASGVTLTVDGSGVTQPVSHAALTELAAAIDTEVQCDIVGSLPAGTNAIGKLAANSGVDIGDVDVTSVTPGTTASALGKAEDAAHTTGDVGVAVLAVRRDSAAVGSGTDGDYSTLNVDANGRLYVACDTHAVTQSGTWNVGTVTTVSDAQVQGKAAHDAAVSGNPVLQGGEARATEPTAVASGDAVRLIADLVGKLVVRPHTIPELQVSGVASATGTGDTSVIAAQGAGVRIYVTEVCVANSSATDSVVEVKDGTTVVWRLPCPQKGGAVQKFDPPLRLTANTALNMAALTGGTTIYFNANGYKGA